jgi:hypothetical protein
VLALEEGSMPPSTGFELAWLGDRPDLLSAMYAVASAASEHRPDFAAGFVRSENEWRTYELGSPLVRLDLTALASSADGVRGYAIAQEIPDEAALYHRAIATLPGDEEQAVTEALIRAQVGAAQAAGMETALALPWNEPLEELYVELGYQSRRTWLEFEGPLPA